MLRLDRPYLLSLTFLARAWWDLTAAKWFLFSGKESWRKDALADVLGVIVHFLEGILRVDEVVLWWAGRTRSLQKLVQKTLMRNYRCDRALTAKSIMTVVVRFITLQKCGVRLSGRRPSSDVVVDDLNLIDSVSSHTLVSHWAWISHVDRGAIADQSFEPPLRFVLQVDPNVRRIHNSGIKHLFELNTEVFRLLSPALEPKVITRSYKVSLDIRPWFGGNRLTTTTSREPTNDNKRTMTLTS